MQAPHAVLLPFPIRFASNGGSDSLGRRVPSTFETIGLPEFRSYSLSVSQRLRDALAVARSVDPVGLQTVCRRALIISVGVCSNK